MHNSHVADQIFLHKKLVAAELYRKRLCRRFQCHPWNKDNLACIITIQYTTPKNHCSNLQHHVCAIAKTIAWIKIVKQHKGTSWLESDACQRKSRGIDGVEKLNRVYVRVVTIDLVYAFMDRLLSRESKKI